MGRGLFTYLSEEKILYIFSPPVYFMSVTNKRKKKRQTGTREPKLTSDMGGEAKRRLITSFTGLFLETRLVDSVAESPLH